MKSKLLNDPNRMGLNGKSNRPEVVVITGASAEVGRATVRERVYVVSAAEQTFPCGNAQIGLSLFLDRNQTGPKLKISICGSGRNFDFCYDSGVKTKPGAKIKGIVAIAFPLGGAQGTDHTFANHYEGETFGLE